MIRKEFKTSLSRSEIFQWCTDTFGKGAYSYNHVPGYRWSSYRYISGAIRVQFTNDEDYTWFMLKWGELIDNI